MVSQVMQNNQNYNGYGNYVPSNKLIPKVEIEETYELLRDFGINIKKSSIPRNISIFDLHMWRKKKIKEYLFS